MKSRLTLRTPASGDTAPLTRFWISLRSGHPATVRAMRTRDVAVGADVDVADHAEVDDGAVQLGILDRAQGLDDLIGETGMGRVLCDSVGFRGSRGIPWR